MTDIVRGGEPSVLVPAGDSNWVGDSDCSEKMVGDFAIGGGFAGSGTDLAAIELAVGGVAGDYLH